MSRWVSLYQALENAWVKASKSPRNFSHTARYSGSTFSAMSVVIIISGFIWPGTWASGVRGASASLGVHCRAPAGLLVCTHSWPNRFSRYSLSQRVGFWVQLPSMPLVIVNSPAPVPSGLCQPRPMASSGAISGGAPILSALTMPWLLPKAWPPAIRATVSSLFIAMRLNEMRMSRAEPIGSPSEFEPSGFT